KQHWRAVVRSQPVSVVKAHKDRTPRLVPRGRKTQNVGRHRGGVVAVGRPSYLPRERGVRHHVRVGKSSAVLENDSAYTFDGLACDRPRARTARLEEWRVPRGNVRRRLAPEEVPLSEEHKTRAADMA